MADRRLSKDEKREIGRLYANGVPTAIIAKQYNVSEFKIVKVLEKTGYIR